MHPRKVSPWSGVPPPTYPMYSAGDTMPRSRHQSSYAHTSYARRSAIGESADSVEDEVDGEMCADSPVARRCLGATPTFSRWRLWPRPSVPRTQRVERPFDRAPTPLEVSLRSLMAWRTPCRCPSNNESPPLPLPPPPLHEARTRERDEGVQRAALGSATNAAIVVFPARRVLAGAGRLELLAWCVVVGLGTVRELRSGL